MKRQPRFSNCILGLAATALLSGCSSGVAKVASISAARATAAGRYPFTDVAASAGIRFQHEHGGASPLNILHTTGSGCAFLDYDGDGWLDVLLLSSAPLPVGAAAGREERSTAFLFRNNQNGAFSDVTQQSGLRGAGYGMGCAAADYDGDGDTDLYLTSHGANQLYRNNGDGTWTDVTAQAGVRGGGWSTVAAFADYDLDGDLDLYVGRYVAFDHRARQHCVVRGVTMACSPLDYAPQPGILYRNNGSGRFTDVTRVSGVYDPRSRTLGVTWGDYDNDGDPDLFVANDAGANNLFQNQGQGRFRDVGLLQGVAYGFDGTAEGSMGVDFGDYDDNGKLDLLVTNFQDEPTALYRNQGSAGFDYASFGAGVGEPSVPMVGFGAAFVDYDNDGQLDLLSANGHVKDTIARLEPESRFAQPRQLFRNEGGGRFRDVSASAGSALVEPAVGRGLALGDYDNDGDVDALVNNNGGPAMLLQNQSSGSKSLMLRLVGKTPNTAAIGARVTIETGGLRKIREVASGRSYASACDPRLHVGLGARSTAERVVIRWPSGQRTELKHVPAGREVQVKQEG